MVCCSERQPDSSPRSSQCALGLLLGRQRADALAVRGAPHGKVYPCAAAAPLRGLRRCDRRRWRGLLSCLGLRRRRGLRCLRRLCSLSCVCTDRGSGEHALCGRKVCSAKPIVSAYLRPSAARQPAGPRSPRHQNLPADTHSITPCTGAHWQAQEPAPHHASAPVCCL